MLISPALAAHGVVGTGGGGGTALLIIIGVAIVFLLVYVGQKKWRRRRRGEDGSDKIAASPSATMRATVHRRLLSLARQELAIRLDYAELRQGRCQVAEGQTLGCGPGGSCGRRYREP